MSVDINFSHIQSVEGTVKTNLADKKLAQVTDVNALITRIGTNRFYAPYNKYWNGSSDTYLAQTFLDVTATRDFIVTQKLSHYGDADTYLSFGTDGLTIAAGGIDFIKMTEDDTQDKFEINANGGNDVDFYVYGSDIVPIIFCEGSSGKVGLGIEAPTTKLHIRETGAAAILLLESTSHYAMMELSDGDGAGVDWQIFSGYPSAGDFTIRQDSLANALRITKTTLYSTFYAGIRINDSGSDTDTVMEGVNDTALFYLDASTDRIGVGVSAPDCKLHIHKATAGTVSALANTQLAIESNDDCYAGFLVPNNKKSGVVFGDVDDNDVGSIIYDNSDNSLTVKTNAAAAMVISSAGAATITDNLKAKSLSGNGTQTVNAGSPTALINEKVTNGGFDSDTAWTKAGGASISGGKLNLSSVSDNAYQEVTTVSGKRMRLSFTIGGASVAVTLQDTSAPGTLFVDLGEYAIGSHDVDFTSDCTGMKIYFEGLSASAATVDGVTLKEFADVTLTPSNTAIEITNTNAYADPEITLAAGSLPVNSIIVISSADANALGLKIITDSDSYFLDGTYYEALMFIKNSVGWRPIKIASA